MRSKLKQLKSVDVRIFPKFCPGSKSRGPAFSNREADILLTPTPTLVPPSFRGISRRGGGAPTRLISSVCHSLTVEQLKGDPHAQPRTD